MELTIGNIIEGKVTKTTPFGAFVRLDNSTVGLIHISEIADTFVNDICDYLHADDMVKVKVISIDAEGKKIGLSLKQAEIQGKETASSPAVKNESKSPGSNSFEDRLAQFMKESNELQLLIKKHRENKK